METKYVELWPYNYRWSDATSWERSVQGFEWALLALIVFFLGLVFWHALFYGLIKGEKKIFYLFHREIVIKLFDYVWYPAGLTSALLILIGLNAQSAERSYQSSLMELDEIRKIVREYMNESNESCIIIQASIDNYQPKVDIIEMSDICNTLQAKRYRKVEKQCYENNIGSDWGTNHSAYDDDKDRPIELTSALNHIDTICSGLNEINDIEEASLLYKKAARRFFDNEEKRSPEWLIIFPLVVSLRLVKTTAELCSSIRDAKDNK